MPALRWLADTFFDPATADDYPAFVINHPEVLGLFGWQQTDAKYFSFHELAPFLQKIDEQGRQADETDSAEQSSYQKAVLEPAQIADFLPAIEE